MNVGLRFVIDAYHPLLAPSALIAKQRLRRVIEADRAAAPAYRWVRRAAGLSAFAALALWPLMADDPVAAAGLGPFFKPRYRWERRK